MGAVGADRERPTGRCDPDRDAPVGTGQCGNAGRVGGGDRHGHRRAEPATRAGRRRGDCQDRCGTRAANSDQRARLVEPELVATAQLFGRALHVGDPFAVVVRVGGESARPGKCRLVDEPLQLQVHVVRESRVGPVVPDAFAHREVAHGVGIAGVQVAQAGLHQRTHDRQLGRQPRGDRATRHPARDLFARSVVRRHTAVVAARCWGGCGRGGGDGGGGGRADQNQHATGDASEHPPHGATLYPPRPAAEGVASGRHGARAVGGPPTSAGNFRADDGGSVTRRRTGKLDCGVAGARLFDLLEVSALFGIWARAAASGSSLGVVTGGSARHPGRPGTTTNANPVDPGADPPATARSQCSYWPPSGRRSWLDVSYVQVVLVLRGFECFVGDHRAEVQDHYSVSLHDVLDAHRRPMLARVRAPARSSSRRRSGRRPCIRGSVPSAPALNQTCPTAHPVMGRLARSSTSRIIRAWPRTPSPTGRARPAVRAESASGHG